MASSAAQRAMAHCAALMRSHDYARYLNALYLSPQQRAHLFVLGAFNVETAMVAERVRERQLAIMRLVWWRDALEDAFKGKAREQPVLLALSVLLQRQAMSKRWFFNIIEARMDDISRVDPPPSMGAVEDYAEQTASSLYYLLLAADGIKSVAADHVASHIGKAEGIAALLRGSAWHHSHRRTFFPIDVAAKHGLLHEDLFRGNSSAALQDATYEMACVAKSHLQKARSLFSSLPSGCKPIMLPAVGVDLFLEQLEKKEFNPLDPSLTRGVWGVSPLWLHCQLATRSWSAKF